MLGVAHDGDANADFSFLEYIGAGAHIPAFELALLDAGSTTWPL